MQPLTSSELLNLFVRPDFKRGLAGLSHRARSGRRAGALIVCRETDNSLWIPQRQQPRPDITHLPLERGDDRLFREDIVFVAHGIPINDNVEPLPSPLDYETYGSYRFVRSRNPHAIGASMIGNKKFGGNLMTLYNHPAANPERPTTSATILLDAAGLIIARGEELRAFAQHI